jgi:hypothetical protein
MGAGPKFQINMIHGVSLGIYIDTFPHKLSITISLIKWNIYFGFGKGYDEL